MTNKELLKTIKDMEAKLGTLPNAIQEPKRYAYYVKLYKYLTKN